MVLFFFVLGSLNSFHGEKVTEEEDRGQVEIGGRGAGEIVRVPVLEVFFMIIFVCRGVFVRFHFVLFVRFRNEQDDQTGPIL